MISLDVIFWMYVCLFALIGAMRGWARELLVSFSVILALFVLSVLERFVPFIRDTLIVELSRIIFLVKSNSAGFFGLFRVSNTKISKNCQFGQIYP